MMADLDDDMSGGSRCCFGLMALLVQILLHGELALTLYWIVQYRWDAVGLPFAFRGKEVGDLDKEWNLHPVLMVTGFIYCMGQGNIKLFKVTGTVTSRHKCLNLKSNFNRTRNSQDLMFFC